ncbi:DUF1501 domain-containing protein [Uliginosibacterium sp. H3]|uniref:DUF1501 domain-containing protein n=1 Tax=Uliginosibacterium silvisoli TaxID=3114758 RepID=A0ABU6K107_9RHOO|nr:DUF1501 domain-containing protein [Uliginosibacterium sp. H3]
MHLIGSASRREFLKRAAALGSLGSAAPFALNLAGIGSAAAATMPSDYKALVCVFLNGGNDHNNTVIPYDTGSHATYAAARGGLVSAGGIALDRTGLLEIVPTTSQGSGRQFAVSAELAPLQALFAANKAAVMANVGPLITPITNAAQYKAGTVAAPPKLFSHNDQQATWQAFSPEGGKVGWGGRLGDMFAAANSNTIFTAISASGNTVFLSGQNIFQYQIGTSGATAISGTTSTNLFGSGNGASSGANVLKSLTQQSSSQVLEQDHASVVTRSIGAASQVSTALATVPATDSRVALGAQANNRLAQQLQIVARLIAVNTTLGAKRQVFFVSLGGFDTHDNQITAQASLHTQLAGAINYFYQATVNLGVANQATLFTASDFGRTLTSNGDGSDHGWGAHHFVVGGAVKGGDIYGTFPVVAMGTTDDVGSGRLLPRSSVDQYASTMAKWFGVSDSELSLIAPNIGNFSTRDLGFML